MGLGERMRGVMWSDWKVEGEHFGVCACEEGEGEEEEKSEREHEGWHPTMSSKDFLKLAKVGEGTYASV